MTTRDLTCLEFELAYLVNLTRYGLKPLSRWEGRLSPEHCDLIRDQGLALEVIRRRTRFGRKRTETIFARNPRRAFLYEGRFHETRLKQTPGMVRAEGRFFGYPACCTDAFIREPYAANNLDPEDQRILFHWACLGCSITPGLLRDYRWIHAECRRIFGTSRGIPRRQAQPWARAATRAAASLALLIGSAGIAAADDPHCLPVPDDADQDHLSFAEEVLRGTDWANPDTDGDTILDGVQTALFIRQLIAAPPPGVVVEEHLMWGSETCSVCGATVNMGFVRITHVPRGRSVDVPFIALHYLDHGGLSFGGDIHTGRVDINALKEILFACDPPHLLPSPGEDPDADGLQSEEEPLLGTDPAIPDTDGDSLIDGPQVAEGLLLLVGDLPREVVPDAPYMLEHRVYGIEQCGICGATLNMGNAEIVNPLEGLSVSVPFVALHSIAHGGFAFAGTVNTGRVIPTILRTVLAGDGCAHWLPLEGDADGDGLLDEEEPYFGLDPQNPDEDQNGTPDGREMATHMASVIRGLPVGPLPDQIYVVHHQTYGSYHCVTCGEEINMGFLEITDPLAGLSIEVPYYNLHFMDRGGFSTDREDIYPRVDPRQIAEVLGIQATDVDSADDAHPFAFWNAPNPFHASGSTRIVLSLPPYSGRIEVIICDSAGRGVRDLYAGDAPEGAMQLQWDGRDHAGERSASGVYFCRVKLGSMAISRRITLID